MKKKLVLLSSITVMALLTFNACGSSVTRDDQSFNGANKGGHVVDGSNEGLINDKKEDNTKSNTSNKDNSGSNGSVSSDTNITTGILKIDAKNAYKVSAKFSDTYNEKGYYNREEIGSINFNITNIYKNNESIDVDKIKSITLEAEAKDSETQGKYFNFIQYDGKEGPKYVIPADKVKAKDDVALKIKDLSGTTNIILSIYLNGFEKPYKLKVPLVIEKNKSSSMAIVKYGTSYNNGLFTDKFVIHVVDSYGNKAKDGTRISTGAINNPKLYSKATNPVEKGILDKDSSTFTLPVNSIDTNKDTISELDTLITLANKEQHKPVNLGGWDISSIDNNSTVSIISFDKGKVENVSYVIGDEYRYDSCNDTIMNAASSTFESTEVKDGIAYAELRYVPAMVGKTIFIYANTRLEDKHIGISRRVPLTGLGLSPVTISCTHEDGKPETATCSKTINFTQNGSEKFAREATIARPLNTGDAERAYVIINDNSNNITSCNGNLKVTINNIDVNKTATYTLGTIASEVITNQK